MFEYRVRVSDTDLMGVVHHAHYPRLFEWAREEYCRGIGHSFASHIDRDEYLAVLQVAYRVKGQVKYDDPLRIVAKVTKATRARLWFDYQVFVDSGNEPAVTGQTEHVILSKAGKILPVPKNFRETISKK